MSAVRPVKGSSTTPTASAPKWPRRRCSSTPRAPRRTPCASRRAPALSVHDGHRVPGVVDEQLLAGAVVVAHDPIDALAQGAVAESTRSSSPRATANSAPPPWHGGWNRPSPLSRGPPARPAGVRAMARIDSPASKNNRRSRCRSLVHGPLHRGSYLSTCSRITGRSARGGHAQERHSPCAGLAGEGKAHGGYQPQGVIGVARGFE